MERQIAAILFADIAGYSALMQQDEQVALSKLLRFKGELEKYLSSFHGTIIQYYGDGCLLIFRSSSDAVGYACAIQKSFMSDHPVPVRIGIHMGDILMQDGNIFGNNVNIASRVESIGIPGAVLFSQAVRDQIINQTGYQYQSIGSFEFKNIQEPVEVFALANAGFLLPERGNISGKLKEKIENQSIAVLPFHNLSGNSEEEYFSDGITEEIIYALSQLQELKVAGRSSSFSFKGRDKDLSEVGRKLQVSSVLEGSFRKSGDRIRVTAQLINVSDGFQLWSERYDRQLTDIFEVQDDIAGSIAEKLKVALFDLKEKSTPTTQNMEAYQWYLKGRHFKAKRIEGYPKSLECFQKSIELDSQYSRAHSGLAVTLFYMACYGMLLPKEAMPKARDAAMKSLELDPTNAEGYCMLGGIAFCYDWDVNSALDYMSKGLALNPNELEINKGLIMMNLVVGNWDKAVFHGKQLIEIEPVNPDARIELAYAYFIGKEFEEALSLADDILELDSNYVEAYRVKGMVYDAMSETEKAILAFKKASEMSGWEGFSPIYLAVTQAKAGFHDEARRALDQLLEAYANGYVPPSFISWIYGALGEMDEAFKWLEKSFEAKGPMLMYLKVEPGFKVLNGDPRFKECEKRLGLI